MDASACLKDFEGHGLGGGREAASPLCVAGDPRGEER